MDKRSGDITFATHGQTGRQSFDEAAESFISRLPIGNTSKYVYRGVYRKHVKPVFGDMTLAQVANDRDGVMDLLVVTMKQLSNAPRQQARHVIVGTVEEAVKAAGSAGIALTASSLPRAAGTAVRTSCSRRTSKSRS